MNQEYHSESEREAAQERSVYDPRNWVFADIHDEKFEERIHQLELSIKSQQQSFSDLDLHLLLCLYNYTGSQKGSVVKEIESIRDFFSFFKYYIDEVIIAASMKSEQFLNQMKNLQNPAVFNTALKDLVENRLVYCGQFLYRTDTEKNLRFIQYFEGPGNLLAVLTLELQKYYREMQDRYQRAFPDLVNDIQLTPDQREILGEYVRDIPVTENLNLVGIMELFRPDDKIYRFIFPNQSWFYIHPQGLPLLMGIARRKIFEVYRYYYMRRSVEKHIQAMMDGIFKEINSRPGEKQYTQEEMYQLLQEEELDENTVLPWYYWSLVISDRLSKQIQMKDNMKKYYQAAYFYRCFLHNRALNIESTGQDLVEKPAASQPAAEPVSVTERIADINTLLSNLHAYPDFYNREALLRMGITLEFQEKYNAPEPGGYERFIDEFIEKASTMVSRTTGQPHLQEISVHSDGGDKVYYVLLEDLASAFLKKKSLLTADFSVYYTEIFSYPDNPIRDKDSFFRHVEEFTASREPLFYKVYSFSLKDIFAQLAAGQDLKHIEELFVNRKSDAPRPLAEILELDFEDLRQLTPAHAAEGSSSEQQNQFHEQEIGRADEDQDSSEDAGTERSAGPPRFRDAPRKKKKFGQWLINLFSWLSNLFKPREARRRGSHEAQVDAAARKKSWTESLGSSLNKAMDKDLKSKKTKAEAMKHFLTGGKTGAPLPGNRGGGGKNKALGTKEILRVIAANVLDNCGLSKVPLEEALERLEEEWNDPMVIAVPDMIAAEKEKRRKQVKKRLNEILHSTRFSLSPNNAEAEIIAKAREITGYADFAALLKRDDQKIYMEWYISLFIVEFLSRDL